METNWFNPPRNYSTATFNTSEILLIVATSNCPKVIITIESAHYSIAEFFKPSNRSLITQGKLDGNGNLDQMPPLGAK